MKKRRLKNTVAAFLRDFDKKIAQLQLVMNRGRA